MHVQVSARTSVSIRIDSLKLKANVLQQTRSRAGAWAQDGDAIHAIAPSRAFSSHIPRRTVYGTFRRVLDIRWHVSLGSRTSGPRAW